jgi:NTP pyrophosphatase (non-canonical NTP hydrolase)
MLRQMPDLSNGPPAPCAAPGGDGITLRQAQRLVDAWMSRQGWDYWQPLAQLARLTEELGELARLINHLFGEKPKKPGEAEQELGLEMADLLYTMICLANSQGVDLQAALERTLEKYRLRDAERYPRVPPAARGPAPGSTNPPGGQRPRAGRGRGG